MLKQSFSEAVKDKNNDYLKLAGQPKTMELLGDCKFKLFHYLF